MSMDETDLRVERLGMDGTRCACGHERHVHLDPGDDGRKRCGRCECDQFESRAAKRARQPRRTVCVRGHMLMVDGAGLVTAQVDRGMWTSVEIETHACPRCGAQVERDEERK